MRAVRGLAAILALLASPASAALSSRPNVLLVSIDSLRADRLGAYGNTRPTSPTIDRLAAEGVRFAHAQSPTSWTLPAHVTLLSGVSQQTHQVLTVGDRIPDRLELLAQTFARRGYETAGFFSGPFLHPTYGFGRGFETYASCESDSSGDPGSEAAWEAAHADRTNPRLEAAFAAWIMRRSSRPFFVFLHMWDVHYDYIPHPPYGPMFDPDYRGLLDGTGIAREGFPLAASRRDVAHLLALYDGELRYTDDVLARMLARLDHARLLDDTLVIVTSDHGEEFLEHGGKVHQGTLYEEVVHVPLILWARSALPPGRTVETPVSLLDVAPTIAELARLSAPKGVEGRSLVPLVHGEAFDERPIFGELYWPVVARLRLVSVRTGSRKVLYDPRRLTWSVFDLAADPREQRALPAVDEALKRMALGHARRAEAALARRTATVAPPPGSIARRRRPAARTGLRAVSSATGTNMFQAVSGRDGVTQS